jgi:hypothetical protein
MFAADPQELVGEPRFDLFQELITRLAFVERDQLDLARAW